MRRLARRYWFYTNKDIYLALISGDILRNRKNIALSIKILERAIKRNGKNENLMHALAKSYLYISNYAKAKTLLAGLIENQYKLFEVWYDTGVCCCKMNEAEESLYAFNQCISIIPTHELAITNKITILKDLNRLKEARVCLDNALKNSNNKDNLKSIEARLLISEGNLHSAATILTRLCSVYPERPEYWLDLASAHRGLRKQINSEKILQMGLIQNPNHHSLSQALIQSLCESGKMYAAKRLLKLVNKEKIVSNDMHFFSLQFLGTSYSLITDEERYTLVKDWEAKRKPRDNMLCINQTKTTIQERRIRVGYLSSDFCNHPVTHFLLPILKNHDKKLVEIWCIYTGNKWDHKSEEVKKHCEHWLNLYGTSDLKAANIISEEQLDILVELGGFTHKSRVGITQHSPATHQMSYLGYPGATYLKKIPWWIGDRTLFKNISAKEKEIHKLLMVEGGYMCLPNPTKSVIVRRSGNDSFHFGSFNHARKISNETILLWSNILKLSPKAKLILKSISFIDPREKDRLLKRFRKYNTGPDKLIFLDYSNNYEKHLELYNLIDIALDPVPYGGATTTAESIWMGVPVLCIHGRGMVGGLSASILEGANISEYICKTYNEYTTKAVSLYLNGKRSREKREKFISRIEKSHFNQPKRLTANLEHIYYKVAQT